jgi:hypothetical protein
MTYEEFKAEYKRLRRELQQNPYNSQAKHDLEEAKQKDREHERRYITEALNDIGRPRNSRRR